jgi:hypothetical protein
MGVSPFIFPNEFFQIEELGLFFKSVLAMIGGRNRVGLYRYFTLNVISYSGQSLATRFACGRRHGNNVRRFH